MKKKVQEKDRELAEVQQKLRNKETSFGLGVISTSGTTEAAGLSGLGDVRLGKTTDYTNSLPLKGLSGPGIKIDDGSKKEG